MNIFPLFVMVPLLVSVFSLGTTTAAFEPMVKLSPMFKTKPLLMVTAGSIPESREIENAPSVYSTPWKITPLQLFLLSWSPIELANTTALPFVPVLKVLPSVLILLLPLVPPPIPAPLVLVASTMPPVMVTTPPAPPLSPAYPPPMPAPLMLVAVTAPPLMVMQPPLPPLSF